MGRPRILFYTHDGRGLGHFVRLCRVAAGMLTDCSCLLVTGHKEASWITPEGCEFLRLPSFDNLLPGRASYWGRRPFVDMDANAARNFRSQLMCAAVREFAPDAIIIDHLAGGRRGELFAALAASQARKYLLLRGVLDTEWKTATEVFPPENLSLIESSFARVLVACDPEVCRIEEEYLGDTSSLAAKVYYVGYVAPVVSLEAREEARQRRGLGAGVPWVVCSAGGGMESEEMIGMCASLAEEFSEAAFDVVWGPRSRTQGQTSPVGGDSNVRTWWQCHELPLLHSAADVVICRGGYNSLMEVASGGAQAICIPLNLEDDQEQLIHATRLASRLPIHLSTGDRVQVSSLLARILECCGRRAERAWREQCGLRFDGIRDIHHLVTRDLSG